MRLGIRLYVAFILTPLLLVDAAAQEADPLRRIAFVAAFAMSNYSSTIGRIAKPFNPMLVRQTLYFTSYPATDFGRFLERNLRVC